MEMNTSVAKVLLLARNPDERVNFVTLSLLLPFRRSASERKNYLGGK